MRRFLLALPLVLLACARDDSMASRSSFFEAVGAEADEHGSRIAAASFATVDVIENDHQAHMRDLMHSMSDSMMTAMHLDLSPMQRECDDHKARMAAAADITAARTEEARHHQAMTDLVSSLRSSMR